LSAAVVYVSEKEFEHECARTTTRPSPAQRGVVRDWSHVLLGVEMGGSMGTLSTSESSTKTLLNIPDLRADTPGCETVIHFNNAGCGLLTRPVLQAMHDHVDLEARIGGYEAAAARKAEVRGFYTAMADLINTGPDNIAFAGSATDAYTKALSAIDFQLGDVILTTRNDFISNQIAFLALRKRFGIRIVHAPDVPNGEGVDVDAMFALMKSLRPRLVTATHVPNNSGLVQPVAEIGRHCRDLDLLYLVDACQSVGQFEIDVKEIGCDMLTAIEKTRSAWTSQELAAC
jgi:selenocysteine lyase/cysteine desulfurase